jgi:hypothetical protein
MFILGSRIVSANREERERAGCALAVVLRELQTGDTDILAWGGNFKFLQEAIGGEPRGSFQRSSADDECAVLTLPHHQMPTRLAQEILLQFLRADTTELRETELFERYPPKEDFAMQQALMELCDQDLLVAVKSDSGDKLYIVTRKGQSLCFSCRD